MYSLILFFFGITLIYTGFLASGRDMTTGLVVACIGQILVIKPALDAVSYYRSYSEGGQRPQERKPGQKVKTKKVHLKIIKSDDDRPTIH